MTNLILTIAFLLPMQVQASEEGCLTKIIFAESRGESIEGAIAVGQATVNRAKRTGKAICKLTGVARLTPPANLIAHYKALAKSVMAGKDSIVRNSDSWNTGTKPRRAGEVVRQIGGHVFYVMSGL
jgi:spore germination cell wall hydrolase CwlJ-like protein